MEKPWTPPPPLLTADVDFSKNFYRHFGTRLRVRNIMLALKGDTLPIDGHIRQRAYGSCREERILSDHPRCSTRV